MEETMDARFEVIDAFVDGERVDAVAFKQALSEDQGRDYLVDAWLLRESVQDEMALEASAPPARPRTRGPRSWLLAAAVIVVSLAGGYAVGFRMAGRVDRTPPGSLPAAGVPAPATSFPTPAPTRVIRVEFNAAPATSGGGE
jgi:hypothetical protein